MSGELKREIILSIISAIVLALLALLGIISFVSGTVIIDAHWAIRLSIVLSSVLATAVYLNGVREMINNIRTSYWILKDDD